MTDDMKAIFAMRIGEIMRQINYSDDLLVILATCIHIWAEERDADVIELTTVLMDAVVGANGIEIEGDREC